MSNSLWPRGLASTWGLPVHHQLLEFTQTPVHRGSDAIQPSHPCCSPFSCLQSFPGSVQFSHVQLFANSRSAACQASLSITNSRSLPKVVSFESVMPSNHPILWRPLLFLPSVFPNIGVFSNESALCIRWPRYWSFSFNISPFQWTPRTNFV